MHDEPPLSYFFFFDRNIRLHRKDKLMTKDVKYQTNVEITMKMYINYEKIIVQTNIFQDLYIICLDVNIYTMLAFKNTHNYK